MADMDLLAAGSWIAAALRSATPLLTVMLGETLTQRTGVINLGVEGEMLMGACVGFAVAATTGSPLLGLFVGSIGGALLSTIHAGLVLGAKANQIGSGLAVWMIGLGLTSYFGRSFVGGQVSPFLPLGAHLPQRTGSRSRRTRSNHLDRAGGPRACRRGRLLAISNTAGSELAHRWRVR